LCTLLCLLLSPLSLSSALFFFHPPATTEIYTLSLHDALPISGGELCGVGVQIGESGSRLRGAGARPLEVIFHGGNPTRHFTHWQVTRKEWAQASSSPLSRRPRRWMPATRCSRGRKARTQGQAAGCPDAVGSCRVLGSSPQRAACALAVRRARRLSRSPHAAGSGR